MKKFIVWLTAVTVAGVMLTSCQSGGDGAQTDNTAPAQTGGSEAAGETADTPQVSDAVPAVGVAANSWETDTSPHTIEWFVAYDWYGKQFTPETNLADKRLLDDTGITIEITTGNIEKFNTLIATNSLPDIVTTDMIATQRTLLENNQQVLPLDTLMAEHAPDLNVPQSMIDWYRNDDGHWYAIASYYYGPERTTPEFGGYYITHNHNFVRTDILEQIGMTMEDMTTKDGFMSALKKVKEMNIMFDGQPVTPFIGASEDFLAQQFGVDLEDKEGNMVNIRRTDEFREALLYLNEMYLNGLITDEEFTRNTQQRDTKVASGSVFAASGWMTVQHPRQALYSSDNNAQMLYCERIKGGDNGQEPLLSSISAGGWTGTMITKNAEKPERIIQLFSYLASDEITLMAEYGEGAFTIEDGRVVKDPIIKQEFVDNYQAAFAKYRLDLQFMEDWTIIQKYYPEPEAVMEADQLKMETDPDVKIYDDKCFTDTVPDAGSEEAIIQERVEAFWSQARPLIIMAPSAEACAAEYEKAIAEMDNLGLKQLDDYRNTRFKENKEKLGVEFVWPRNL